MAWRLICLPESRSLRAAAHAQRINPLHDTMRAVPGEQIKIVKPTKLLAKRKIEAAAKGGLDEIEAIAIGVQSPDGGGFSMSTIG